MGWPFPSVVRRLIAAVLTVIAVAACQPAKPPTKADEPLKAPFRARYAGLELQVPDRADLYQATKHGFGMHVRICARDYLNANPALCDAFASPLVNMSGVSTFVTEPRPGTHFKLLREKPAGVSTPPHRTMRQVPERLVDTDLGGFGEAGQLSRLRPIWSKQLFTTEEGWPIAGCETHRVSGQRYCVIGFLIKGAFVEASVFSEGAELDQRQVWMVASALDAKLRALAVD